MYRTALMSSVAFSFCAHPVLCSALIGVIVGSIVCLVVISDVNDTHVDISVVDYQKAYNRRLRLKNIPDVFKLKYPECGQLELGPEERTCGVNTRGCEVLELSMECSNLVPNPILRVLRRVYQTKRRGTLTFAVLYERDRQPVNIQSQLSGSSSNTPDDSPWKQIGQTEIVSHCNNDCRFVTKFNVGCATFEERNKSLRIEVYQYLRQRKEFHARNMIGAAEFSASEVLSEPLYRQDLVLKSSREQDKGYLRVCGNLIRQPSVRRDVNKITLKVDLWSSNRMGIHAAFYVLSRQLPSGDFTSVYRSEVIGRGIKMFDKMVKDVDDVNGGGSDDTLLRLEVYQFSGNGKHTRLGFTQLSVAKLRGMEIGQPLTWWPCTWSDQADRSVRDEGWSKRLMDIGQVELVEKSGDKFSLSLSSDRYLRWLSRLRGAEAT